ncbi:MAG: YjbH domain-containing protein [Tannerella sp.]|jgi:hypothetical protein|nr:YjbH domain-containing protein [Tannerella sp.]
MKKALFLLCLFLALPLWGQNLEGQLAALGLEDLRVGESPRQELVAAFSNKVYREPARALLEALKCLLPQTVQPGGLRLIYLEERVPQVALSLDAAEWRAYQKGRLSLPELVNALHISYDTGDYDELAASHAAAKRSPGRIDLVLYPRLWLDNAWFNKLYGVAFDLAPALEMGLWKGASLTAQVILPLLNNVNGERDYIRPGFLLFRQAWRFPKNFFATFSIGNFNADRFGADFELRYRASSGLWSASLEAGQTGSSTIENGHWRLSQWQHTTGAASFTWRPAFYGLRFDFTAQRYLHGDYGFRFDLSRHFGETVIGFYALRTGGLYNGGFRFAVPLPRRKRAQRRAFRLRLPEYFDWEYSAQSGNEYVARQLGEYYETRPDESPARADYNPAYLKHAMLDLAEGAPE